MLDYAGRHMTAGGGLGIGWVTDPPTLGVAKQRLEVANLGKIMSLDRARNLLRMMGVRWKEGDSGRCVYGIKVTHLNITCECAGDHVAPPEGCRLICKHGWGFVKPDPVVTVGAVEEGVCCKCITHGGETAECQCTILPNKSSS